MKMRTMNLMKMRTMWLMKMNAVDVVVVVGRMTAIALK
jgi:hypothetical protein